MLELMTLAEWLCRHRAIPHPGTHTKNPGSWVMNSCLQLTWTWSSDYSHISQNIPPASVSLRGDFFFHCLAILQASWNGAESLKFKTNVLVLNNRNGIALWGGSAPEGLCSKKRDSSRLRQQNNPISRTFKLCYNEVKFATDTEAADALRPPNSLPLNICRIAMTKGGKC